MSDMRKLIREEVVGIPPYNAGLTLEEVRQRYQPVSIAKLGSNENPLGAPDGALRFDGGLHDLVRLYPDPKGRELCQAIADALNVTSPQVILGNGSEDLIGVICRAVVRPADTVTTLYPSFPLHEDYAALMGGKLERIEVLRDLTVDVPALIEAARRKPKMIMFANPMNPVGSWIGAGAFRDFLDAVDSETLLVVDEAYAEYASGDDYISAVDHLAGTDKNWVVLRTFSKAFGLAGLRIGFGITSNAALREVFDRVRTPFNTNAIAQHAALAALADNEHLQRTVELARNERERLATGLVALNLKVAPSKGNFLFFDCGTNAVEAAEKLLAEGVIVKPWKQKGYENFIRVSIGSPAENDHFLRALTKVLG
ncbi:histidinol-phosphate transaminase [Rhizobium sp. AC44/96]|uniref:histidinol-phosphate transaminase n=1 Tax=Rhizobium sp. AC44/96 TaxID=1841654 RepID=UPI00080FBC6D|nr:histidinol-phosphate transaminase [Rhizobium sp. AC44/96]OCJ12931.1 histidinol-phosphate transaminase [Rhizobium sp. AC44/96]